MFILSTRLSKYKLKNEEYFLAAYDAIEQFQ